MISSPWQLLHYLSVSRRSASFQDSVVVFALFILICFHSELKFDIGPISDLNLCFSFAHLGPIRKSSSFQSLFFIVYSTRALIKQHLNSR